MWVNVGLACWSLMSLCHSNGPCQPEKLNPLPTCPGFDPSFSGHNDEQSSASGQNYASDRSAIGAGWLNLSK